MWFRAQAVQSTRRRREKEHRWGSTARRQSSIDSQRRSEHRPEIRLSPGAEGEMSGDNRFGRISLHAKVVNQVFVKVNAQTGTLGHMHVSL